MAGDYDYVFWLGDLNYRVDMERSVVDQYMEQHHRRPEDWLVSVYQWLWRREISLFHDCVYHSAASLHSLFSFMINLPRRCY